MESININNERTICIIGIGGFAREVFYYVIDVLKAKQNQEKKLESNERFIYCGFR